MAEVNWGLAAQNDPFGSLQKGFSYADKLLQMGQQRRAGGLYANGDLKGAAQALAIGGDVSGAAQIEQGQTQREELALKRQQTQEALSQQHLQYAGAAAQHLNDKYDDVVKNGGTPEQATAAVLADWDAAPAAIHAPFGTPEEVAQFRQHLAADPKTTLTATASAVQRKLSFHTDGNGQIIGLDENTGRQVGQPVGAPVPKFGMASAGSVPIPENQAAVDALNGGASQQQPAQAANGAPSQLIPGVSPTAMHTVESGNNPNAVSPAGAVGMSQTMPATLASPGYGVSPAANNSPGEQQRVGDQLLAKLNEHYGNPVLAHIAYNWGPGNTDKWLAAGGDFSKLPAETQTYLGRIAVAQAQQQRGQGAPAFAQPPAQGQARLGQPYGQPRPVWRPPTPEELKQYPGAIAMNINGEPKYPPASQVAANMSTDQLQPFVDNLKAGGALPASLARNPASYAKVLQLAREQGVSMQDVLANQGTRKATQATFQQVSTRYAMVQTQEQAFQNSLALAQQKIQALGNQNGGKFLLGWKNYLKTGATGDPATGAAINAVDTAMNEYAKIIEGSTGNGGSSVSARQDANNMLSGADNIPAFMEKIGVLKADAGYKIGALKDQYDTLSGALHSIGDAKPSPTGSAPKKIGRFIVESH